MPLVQLVVILVVVGVLLYVVQTSIPMNAAVKRIVVALVLVLLCVWLLDVFGIIGPWHVGAPRRYY